MKSMKILLASSEVVPFSKTGGLADVTGTLPCALKEICDCDVRVVSPLYKMTKEKKFNLKRVKEISGFPFFEDVPPFELFESENKGVTFYFIKKDEYFDRDGLYGTPKGDYEDNAERFGFFSKAILLVMLDRKFYPEIIHLHDWQTALLPLYKRLRLGGAHPLMKSKILFTIHNLGYQGLFNADVLNNIGIPEEYFNMDALEFYGKASFIKSGIIYSDAISTVSKKYAKEILTNEYGCGLDGLLKTREQVLHGILNGADYSDWNPETDKLIPTNYGPETIAKKALCKKELLKYFKMTLPSSHPLIGFVGRLAEQKGIDLMANSLGEIIEAGAGFVLLGTGSEEYEKVLKRLARRYKGKTGINIAFDNKLAHTIEAGVDIFVIPSRYEPCGLNQMYSLKYGTVPLVRATGGLDDTITDYSDDPKNGNGFKFERADINDFMDAIYRALEVFGNKEEWLKLQKRGMEADFSWHRSAREYISLFGKMIG
jgi:starch synthase